MLRALAAAAGVIGFSATLTAQETTPAAGQSPTPSGNGEQYPFPSATALTPRPGNSLRINANADFSYVAGSKAEFRGAKGGDSDAHSIHVGATAVVPLDSEWFVPVGVSSGNIFLDSVTRMPVPDDIHTIRLYGGLGYRFNERLTVSGQFGPNFYRLDNVDTSTIGFSGLLNAVYRFKPTLTLAFGVAFNPDSEIPVLPIAGARWDISEALTLNLMYPRPALIYRLTPKLNLFTGADIKFTTFRAEEGLGNRIGLPRYNNAIATYRDFHFGVGAEYEILPRLWVSAEGGYSFGREIEYTRIDESVDFDSAPYAQVGLRYRF